MEGSEQSGSRFEKNRVGGSNQAIKEQVGKQNTRDWVGGRKRAFGERVIGGNEQLGSDQLRSN